jgi:methyl-accepting chemotaxis protein
VIADMKEAFSSIVKSIENTGASVEGFIDLISLRTVEIYKIRESITSTNQFAINLSRSTEEQLRNTLDVTGTIERVNADAQEFVVQSSRLARFSSELREIALVLSEKLGQFKI